jgi:hypothetical protein
LTPTILQPARYWPLDSLLGICSKFDGIAPPLSLQPEQGILGGVAGVGVHEGSDFFLLRSCFFRMRAERGARTVLLLMVSQHVGRPYTANGKWQERTDQEGAGRESLSESGGRLSETVVISGSRVPHQVSS